MSSNIFLLLTFVALISCGDANPLEKESNKDSNKKNDNAEQTACQIASCKAGSVLDETGCQCLTIDEREQGDRAGCKSSDAPPACVRTADGKFEERDRWSPASCWLNEGDTIVSNNQCSASTGELKFYRNCSGGSPLEPIKCENGAATIEIDLGQTSCEDEGIAVGDRCNDTSRRCSSNRGWACPERPNVPLRIEQGLICAAEEPTCA